jgi:cell division protein FtsX
VAQFGTPAVKRRWLGSALLTSQIAIALVLLVATSTLLSLVVRLTRSEFGLHNQRAVTFQVTLPASSYGTGADVAAFARRLETTIRSMPGTRAIGLTDFMPASVGAKRLAHLEMRDRPVLSTGAARRESHATMLVATHDYFRAVGVPLLAGRFFEPREAEPVVILNESAARMFAPDITRVVGKRLVSPNAEVVGVVGDVQLDVDVPEAIRAMTMAHVYQPLSHSPPNGTVAVAVDTAGDFPSVVAAVRRGLHDIDPGLAIDRVSRVGDLPARIFASEQLTLALSGVFALVVLGLAGIGLYGVLAQCVAERTREIGIRMALGASRAYLRAGIAWIALRLTLIGIAIGLGLAVTAWKLASASIPSLDVPNLPLLAADAAVLIVVSLLAAWIPARRASAIDPVEALRAE